MLSLGVFALRGAGSRSKSGLRKTRLSSARRNHRETTHKSHSSIHRESASEKHGLGWTPNFSHRWTKRDGGFAPQSVRPHRMTGRWGNTRTRGPRGLRPGDHCSVGLASHTCSSVGDARCAGKGDWGKRGCLQLLRHIFFSGGSPESAGARHGVGYIELGTPTYQPSVLFISFSWRVFGV